MTKQSKTVHKKSRGRPAGTKYSETIPARLEPATLASLDAWAAANDVSRSEAIRRLVEIGLTVEAKPKQAPPERAARAKELASRTIDTLTAGATDDDTKASRKRRLIKGPEEFQEVRVDRPKVKGK
jgi:hypothetical protein